MQENWGNFLKQLSCIKVKVSQPVSYHTRTRYWLCEETHFCLSNPFNSVIKNPAVQCSLSYRVAVKIPQDHCWVDTEFSGKLWSCVHERGTSICSKEVVQLPHWTNHDNFIQAIIQIIIVFILFFGFMVW